MTGDCTTGSPVTPTEVVKSIRDNLPARFGAQSREREFKIFVSNVSRLGVDQSGSMVDSPQPTREWDVSGLAHSSLYPIPPPNSRSMMSEGLQGEHNFGDMRPRSGAVWTKLGKRYQSPPPYVLPRVLPTPCNLREVARSRQRHPTGFVLHSADLSM